MPRITDSAGDAHDFCNECLPDHLEAHDQFGNVGHGPDGRGNCFEYEAIHPDYEGEGMECETCFSTLKERDN